MSIHTHHTQRKISDNLHPEPPPIAYQKPHWEPADLIAFTTGYIAALYFTEGDQFSSDAPLDRDTRQTITADCAQFLVSARTLLQQINRTDPDSLEQAGHDFWLTRNGHGAGFWDGDYPEPQGTELTRLSDQFGPQEVYLSDAGEVAA